jgi:hypothetical protein
MAFIAFMLSFAYSFLVIRKTKMLVNMSFILSFMILIGGGVSMGFMTFRAYPVDSLAFVADFFFSIFCIFSTLIILALYLNNFKRLNRAIKLTNVFVKFTQEVPTLFVVPIILFIVLFGAFTFWIGSGFYFFSIFDLPEPSLGAPQEQINWDFNMRYVYIF